MQAVLVTRGGHSMALFSQGNRPHVPIFSSDEVTDVTGAGTPIATFGLARGQLVLRGAPRQLRRRDRR
jgi:bifunctional ADP-heptose synthase (sugar kinase/adenylyltransferase)